MRFDWKTLGTGDRVVACAAGVVFIALFLPWWGVNIGGIDYSVDGWSSGFTAWAGGTLLTAAGVILVLRRSGTTFAENLRPSVLAAGVAALGLLLVIIRWASLPRYQGLGVGARYGLYIGLIAGIVEVAAAVLEMRVPEEPRPDAPAAPEE